MDWIIGLSTFVLIVLGALAFAHATIYHGKPEHVKPDPDYKAILAKQARDADVRARQRSHAGLSWDQWLHWAAVCMARQWPSVSYDDARRMIREYMADVAVYPDPDFDWSLASARETAEEYMREYGDHHGANS